MAYAITSIETCPPKPWRRRKLWLFKAVPGLKDYIPDPASPDYVVIKMSPDNIRVMETIDMKYSQVKLK